MKKMLVLGSGGMLGHVVALYFRGQGFKVCDVSRSKTPIGPDYQMDVTDFDGIRSLYQKEHPEFIINCVGILNMNAENNPVDAIQVNSYLPHYLEHLTHGSSCRVVHVSTDCVFSGNRGGYNEDDFMDGDGYYARTKALGEIRNGKDLTLRTSIIGPELHTNGIGLFQWFSASSGTIKGYTKVFWTGITTIELAKAIHHCMDNGITGLYHMVNNQRISKHALLSIFSSVFEGSKVENIQSSTEKAYDKSLINNRTDLPYKVPDYQFMVEEMKAWISQHSALYPHYTGLL